MTSVALIVALGVMATMTGGLLWATYTAMRATRDMATADNDRLLAERGQKDAEDERDDAIAGRAQMEKERDDARALAAAAQASRNELVTMETNHARATVLADPVAGAVLLDGLLSTPILPADATTPTGPGHGGTTPTDMPAAGPASTNPTGRDPG